MNFASIENGAKGKCAVIALWVTLGGWGWPNCSWGLPTDGPSSNTAVFRIIQYSRGHRTRKIPYALDCVWVGVMLMVPCAIGDEDQHSIQTGNPEEGVREVNSNNSRRTEESWSNTSCSSIFEFCFNSLF